MYIHLTLKDSLTFTVRLFRVSFFHDMLCSTLSTNAELGASRVLTPSRGLSQFRGSSNKANGGFRSACRPRGRGRGRHLAAAAGGLNSNGYKKPKVTRTGLRGRPPGSGRLRRPRGYFKGSYLSERTLSLSSPSDTDSELLEPAKRFLKESKVSASHHHYNNDCDRFMDTYNLPSSIDHRPLSNGLRRFRRIQSPANDEERRSLTPEVDDDDDAELEHANQPDPTDLSSDPLELGASVELSSTCQLEETHAAQRHSSPPASPIPSPERIKRSKPVKVCFVCLRVKQFIHTLVKFDIMVSATDRVYRIF